MKHFLMISGAVALGMVVGGAILYGIYAAVPTRSVDTPSDSVAQIDYQAFVSIVLTAVSVILAGLGFVIAILAFIGWNSIGERVSTLATSFLKNALDDGGPLHNMVRDEVKDIMYKDIEPVDKDFEEEDEKADPGEK